MTQDVYERLAAHLDRLPTGYPRTPGGVELRILRRLFTPAEAAVALHLTLIAEEPRVVALRAGLPVEETRTRLETMHRKGLIFSELRGGTIRYMAFQYLVGFWEGQVDKLDPGLVEDFEEYLPVLFDAEVRRGAPQMRIVPVGASLAATTEAMPYEIITRLVESTDRYAVSNCICRQEMELLGKGCGRPMASCLEFGAAAGYITRSGRGRSASRQEVIDILGRAEEAGLVVQASNTRDAVFVCTCCGCCCALLRSLRRLERPSSVVASPFVATLDRATCNGCLACESRCQMEALRQEDGAAVLDQARCIGCGLCVGTCPTGALALARKPPAEQRHVPRNIVESYLRIGRARGHLGAGELIGLQLRSIIDRWRAPAQSGG